MFSEFNETVNTLSMFLNRKSELLFGQWIEEKTGNELVIIL